MEPDRFSAVEPGRVLVEGHHRGAVGGSAFDVEFIHLWTVGDGVATAYREYC